MNIKYLFKQLAVSVINISPVNAYLSNQTKGLATIFMLHRMDVGNDKYDGHSPDFLESALKYLRDNGYNFTSVEELLLRSYENRPPLKKAVAFTMDDGYRDQARIALPIFEKYNCPVTVFLITGFIDNEILPWDTIIKYCFYETDVTTLRLNINNKHINYDLSSYSKRISSMRDFRELCKTLNEEELMDTINMLSQHTQIDILTSTSDYIKPLTWDEARIIEETSDAKFGVHTINHLILSRISEQSAAKEINESWHKVSLNLNHPVKIFAYPIGRYDDFLLRDIEIIKQNNYLGAVTAEPGYFNQIEASSNEYSRYMIKRFSFPDNLQDLVQFCSGIELIKHKLRNNYLFDFWNNKRYLFHLTIYRISSILGCYYKFLNLDWSRIDRLVFVCKGNICRSPYAEYKSIEFGLNTISVGIDTDGISNADEMAMKISALRGVDISAHTSRKTNQINYSKSDLLVCMEPWQANEIMKNINIIDIDCQVTILGLWCTNKIALIRDPYNQSIDMFNKCFDLIDDSLSNIYHCLEK